MSTDTTTVDADGSGQQNGVVQAPTAAEKSKERMRQWYLTRGKDQRARKRGRGQPLTGTLQAKRVKPDASGHYAAASHFAPFDPECDESRFEPHVRQYEVFEHEEIETIKDIIFDYLNEEKEKEKEEKPKPSLMSGAVVAIGTAMAPVLAKTAYESRDAIKNVGSFLGSRIWKWPSGVQCNLSTSTPSLPAVSAAVSAVSSPELLSGACDENVVVV